MTSNEKKIVEKFRFLVDELDYLLSTQKSEDILLGKKYFEILFVNNDYCREINLTVIYSKNNRTPKLNGSIVRLPYKNNSDFLSLSNYLFELKNIDKTDMNNISDEFFRLLNNQLNSVVLGKDWLANYSPKY